MNFTYNFSYKGRPKWGTANHAPSPQKTFLIGWCFWGGGWCANCRSLRKRQNTHHPPVLHFAMLIVDFVGVVRGFRTLTKHDHDHFRAHLAERHFSILGYPWMLHQMPLLHSATQRKHKNFSLDAPSVANLMRSKYSLETYGCSCVWAVPDCR